jgi:hypothetical protein
MIMSATAAEAAVVTGVEAKPEDAKARPKNSRERAAAADRAKQDGAAPAPRQTAAQKAAAKKAAEVAARAAEAEKQAKIGQPKAKREPKPKPAPQGPAVLPNGRVVLAELAESGQFGYVIKCPGAWVDWSDTTRRVIVAGTAQRGWKVGTKIKLHHAKLAQPGIWAAADFEIVAVVANSKITGEAPAKVSSWNLQK